MEKTVLGYKFRALAPHDRDGFAGAEPGSLICTDRADDVIMIHLAGRRHGHRDHRRRQ
jgi:hypothetical protein